MIYQSKIIQRICFKCKNKNTANTYICPSCNSTSNVPIGYKMIDTEKFRLCKTCKKLHQASCKTCSFYRGTPLYKTTLPEATSGELIFREGIKALRNNDYTNAFQNFKVSYDDYKFQLSLFALAECFYLGYGTEKDIEKAIKYLEKSKLPESQKKLDLYRKEYNRNANFFGKAKMGLSNTELKTEETVNKKNNPIESKIAFSIPIKFHPIKNEKISVKQAYFSLLYDTFSKLEFKSPYAQAVFEYYCSTFPMKRKSKNIYYKIPSKIKSCIYYDFMIILGYDRNIMSEKMLAKIKKITGVYYDDLIKILYSFSENSDIAWQEIIFKEKNKAKKKWLSKIKENYDYVKKKPFRILITATMSAGKSTLINSIIGKKIAKVQNEACTGRIHYIYNKPFEDNLIGKWEKSQKPIIDGENAILSDNEAEVDLLSYESSYFQNTIPGTRLLLLDTPGINSAEHKNHGEITKQVIANQQYDLMLYVINYTVESADDNEQYLHDIKETLNIDIPVIFLINKVDSYEYEDTTLLEKLQQITNNLKKIGYTSPIVFPFSASVAFYAQQLIQKYDFSRPEDFLKLYTDVYDQKHFSIINSLVQNEQLHLEQYYHLPKKEEKIIYQKLTDAKAKNDLFGQAIVHSGLSSLMSVIYTFIQKG